MVGRKPRQQQRLVANIGGMMDRRVDAYRSGEPAAIAAAEEERPLMRGEQKCGNRERRRRLAGAADGEIAETNDRQAGAGGRTIMRKAATAP